MMLVRTVVRRSVLCPSVAPRASFAPCTVAPSSLLSSSSSPLLARQAVDVANGFEIRWRTMTDAQRETISKEYAPLEAQDWHTLSLEQKRAIYTIAYGTPAEVDPYERWKVVGGTAAVLALGLSLFALVRSGANPAPVTLTPEYRKATEEYLKKQNANPIFGISSKKEQSPDDLNIQ